MLLCLNAANQPTASSELNYYRKSDIQIANGDEIRDTMQSQVNESRNSRQLIGKIHNGFQLLENIIVERLNNT